MQTTIGMELFRNGDRIATGTGQAIVPPNETYLKVRGRDPATVRRTVAVHVRLPGGQGRTMGDTTTTDRIVPLEGSPERMADELRAYAAAGVDEVQAVLDPIEGLTPDEQKHGDDYLSLMRRNLANLRTALACR